eukprot:scaffold854_cov343-Prasinococcus_capsulatus_cf.AAC.9
MWYTPSLGRQDLRHAVRAALFGGAGDVGTLHCSRLGFRVGRLFWNSRIRGRATTQRTLSLSLSRSWRAWAHFFIIGSRVTRAAPEHRVAPRRNPRLDRPNERPTGACVGLADDVWTARWLCARLGVADGSASDAMVRATAAALRRLLRRADVRRPASPRWMRGALLFCVREFATSALARCATGAQKGRDVLTRWTKVERPRVGARWPRGARRLDKRLWDTVVRSRHVCKHERCTLPCWPLRR